MADALLPMLDPSDLLNPFAFGCFVAIDLMDGRRLVGTVKGTSEAPSGATLLHLELPNGAHVVEAYKAVQMAFYAPMGYRAPDLHEYTRR